MSFQMLLLKWFYPFLFNKRNTNHTCTVVHVNREMHIEIGTSSNFAFAFTVAIKETRDHQLQPPKKICTKYRKYIFPHLICTLIRKSGVL